MNAQTAFCVLGAVCVVSGCSSPSTTTGTPGVPAAAAKWRLYQTGIASWYGGRMHGGPTASGERFDRRAMTAAHRKLPFETRVRVTCLRTGRSCIVRINDRGPFIRGRIIDLSERAAREIGLHAHGLARVTVEVAR